jgi:hypothetical protein
MNHTAVIDLQIVVYPDGSWAVLDCPTTSEECFPKEGNYTIYATRTLLQIPPKEKPEGVQLRRTKKTVPKKKGKKSAR